MEITVKDIGLMSYPDFVGFLAQKNTPPGGSRTIERWIQMAKIKPESIVFDLACSTGFSSRSTVKRVGCRAKGIDISAPAIETAIQESNEEGIGERTEFRVGDACRIPFADQEFSHILAGSTFGFIHDRDLALKECRRILIADGALCIGNFYYSNPPPESLLDEVSKMVGFRPNANWTHDWWNSFFGSSFSLNEEEDDVLRVLSESDISELVRKLIFESSATLKSAPDEIKDACYNRLRSIRLVLNEHRKYQRLNISIWNRK